MLISIIDDEKILADKTKRKLEKQGYTVNVYHNCSDFYNAYYCISDLYIIDLGLGDGSGFDIIKWIRNEKQIDSPIIITSAYADADKKIYGLDIGADDYMTKPMIPEELLARIKVQLRRTQGEEKLKECIKYRNITFDTHNNMVILKNEKIFLARKEAQILKYLLSRLGQLVSKNEIIHAVWDNEEFGTVTDNTINVTVSKLRSKLGNELKLRTRKSAGYILEE